MFLCVSFVYLGAFIRDFVQDDEEWDDYRENKKDFTGLKIEKLVIEEPSAKPEEEDTEVMIKTVLGKKLTDIFR